MASKKASFQSNWLDEAQFSKWLDTIPNDIYSARCKLCMKTFCLSNMGRRAVTSHMASVKHRKLENAATKSLPMQLFTKPSSTIEKSPSLERNSNPSDKIFEGDCIKNNQDVTTQLPNCSTLAKYKIKDEVTSAEILWCLNTVLQHSSLRNAESSVSLFQKMFPDSCIAREMKLHKDKVAYSIVFGLAYYFKEELKTLLNASSNYVVGFDESLNKVSVKTQMDLSIRYWDENTDSVKTRYLNSVFLHRAKAKDLLEAFMMGIQGLDIPKILQISMDGPNVNWSFYKHLKNEINTSLGPEAPQLLELGSCGLHVIHGAFKTGINKTEWKIIEYLRAVYNLFKMVPSRRGHFIEITDCTQFPLPFCTVRWVENSRVAKRSQDILPALKKYVASVKGTNVEPTCNSFKIVEAALKDKFLLAKLAFFQSFAEELEPFLTEFQTDSPMAPFLYDSLSILMKGIMNRFVKKEAMMSDNFVKVNMFEKKDGLFKNLMKVSEIDLGYGTCSAIRQCQDLKDKEVLEFRKEIRSCLQHFVAKVQERSPLKYPLTKAISFLNPSNISINEDEACRNMSVALDYMIQSSVITPAKAERADREFKKVLEMQQFKFECREYRRKNVRLDKFWMTEVQDYENLKEVTKKILLLSHGNASVERGFSVNKNVLVENLKDQSLVAQRMIYDSVTSAGGMEEFTSQPIPKKMVLSMRNAHSRFKEAEDYRKKAMTEKDKRVADKRKTIIEMKELEAKKAKLMKEALQEADSLTSKIENLKKCI